jgi:hypothetical protein
LSKKTPTWRRAKERENRIREIRRLNVAKRSFFKNNYDF